MIRVLGYPAALLLIAVGASAVWVSWGYGLWEGVSPGGGFFPAAAGALLVLFALVTIVTELRANPDVADSAVDATPSWPRLAGYIAALIGFSLLLEPLGAFPSIVLLFLWILLVVERLPWRLILSVTAGSAIGVWFLFDYLLKVPLPRGPFG